MNIKTLDKETTLIQGIMKIRKKRLLLGPHLIQEDKFYRKLRKIVTLNLKIKCKKYKSKKLSEQDNLKMNLNNLKIIITKCS